MQLPSPDELRKRAMDLYMTRKCPHCGNELTVWQALAIVFGSAIDYAVTTIHVESGTERVRSIRQVNPQTMWIVHEESPIKQAARWREVMGSPPGRKQSR